MKEIIAIDSNCYSYLLDVMKRVEKPDCAVATEKIAMLQLYLYLDSWFGISEAVKQEYMKINNIDLREFHISTNMVLIDSFPLVPNLSIRVRTEELGAFHRGEMDCRVLAEAEYGKADYLLTYDEDFKKHLSSHAKQVKILSPSQLLHLKNVLPGSKPNKEPHHTNPLSKETFWII